MAKTKKVQVVLKRLSDKAIAYYSKKRCKKMQQLISNEIKSKNPKVTQPSLEKKVLPNIWKFKIPKKKVDNDCSIPQKSVVDLPIDSNTKSTDNDPLCYHGKTVYSGMHLKKTERFRRVSMDDT